MLKNEIIAWVKQQPYWIQVMSNIILKDGKLDRKNLDDIYILFKKEFKLQNESLKIKKMDFLMSDDTHDSHIKMRWNLLSDIQGVNALKENQSLKIGKQLTIIYGKNGSGKSSYTRIFNNAFISRGDKKILGNISKKTKVKPNAKFEFTNEEGENIDLSFPKDRNNYLFNTISVFDTKSAMHDLTEEDQLAFAPIEFNFFDELIKGYTAIKDMRDEEIKNRTKEKYFIDYFDKNTLVKKAVEKINGQTNYNEIELMADVSKLDEIYREKVKRKRDLQSLNIDEKLKEYNNIKNDLDKLKEKVTILNDRFSTERIKKTLELVNERTNLKRISDNEGITQFEDENIYRLGSFEWKNFISAADMYYKSIDEKIKNCIFCGQTIEKISVIDKYWSYLRSSAEKKLSDNESNIIKLKENFDENLTLVVKSSRLEEWLKKNQVDLYEKLITAEKNFTAIKSNIVENLSNLEWNRDIEAYNVDISSFDKVYNRIEQNIKQLDANKVSKELNEIDKFINEYNDKLKLKNILPEIKKFISCMGWVKSAEKVKLSTQKITAFQNKLFTKYVSKKYIEHFEIECNKLNADFSAQIQQRGSKGATLSKLTIKGNNPIDVLSEGEQRSVALANFLAETSVDGNNECLVFDDPVSSLDHDRREIIANRLVEEAKEKQIVILTHDISFFLSVQKYCNKNDIECYTTSIINIDGMSGIVQEAPWIGSPVSKRIKKLRNMLRSIQSFYKNDITNSYMGMESYRDRVKNWCELLRETWERTVEEILLNGSIQRLNPEIQTQRLKKATYTKDLYKELEAGMANCSSWIHDRASALEEDVPTPDRLNEYLKSCEKFINDNRPK